jgi:uncharacterized repeat protein (TIGR01451 family)
MNAYRTLLLTLLGVAIAGPALGAGTLSNTPIDNRASVVYDVSGVTQTVIESSPGGNSSPGVGVGADTTFLVDNKIDLTVAETDATYTISGAGSTDQVLTFTVTNDGNTVQDFSLTTANGSDPFGGTDNFDATGTDIFVDSNSNGTYEAGVDTATYIDELAPDVSVAVFVVRSIPGGQVDGDISAIVLTAQAAVGGTGSSQGADITTDDSGSADLAGTVQIVFADGDGLTGTEGPEDGAHSDTDAYIVGEAQISIQKISTVISDPFNGTVNPKAIPGAIVEYTVTVTNDAAATATATNIVVTDSLDTEITAGTVSFDADGYAAGQGIRVTAPNINGGAAKDLTNASDGDEGAFSVNAVTVNGIELQANESATVTFRVEIL